MKKVIIAVSVLISAMACQQKLSENQLSNGKQEYEQAKEEKLVYKETNPSYDIPVAPPPPSPSPPPVTEESISNHEIKSSNNHQIDGVNVEYFKSEAISPTEIPHDRTRRINIHQGNEEYSSFTESDFVSPIHHPLSTLSIDVDRASYSNVRRYLQAGQLPPPDAVRVEEMINYFDYNYATPTKGALFRLNPEIIDCPWNKGHKLLHFSMNSKEVQTSKLPNSNLVFLIDVSGSMTSPNKLGLVKSSLKMLLNQLRDEDQISIVTYAGSAGVALKTTKVKNKEDIANAITKLTAGGSTAGAEGINTAYELAEKAFLKEGNNRIILATDGDFNVGVSSVEGLEDLIAKKRDTGIYLSVLGYGMGNYKDNRMQILAQKGNGNHAYIDNLQEAHKVLVKEFTGTLFTLAKDVKLQLEFNPSKVASYRLIGYETRLLNKEDFNNDKKDAGELGAGHVVTAIWELIPVGVESSFLSSVDPLKYQDNEHVRSKVNTSEWATVKMRYKEPDRSKSRLEVVEVVGNSLELYDANEDQRFSIAVAQFALILQESKLIENKNLEDIIDIANRSRSFDKDGYRAEFIRLVESLEKLGLLASR